MLTPLLLLASLQPGCAHRSPAGDPVVAAPLASEPLAYQVGFT